MNDVFLYKTRKSRALSLSALLALALIPAALSADNTSINNSISVRANTSNGTTSSDNEGTARISITQTVDGKTERFSTTTKGSIEISMTSKKQGTDPPDTQITVTTPNVQASTSKISPTTENPAVQTREAPLHKPVSTTTTTAFAPPSISNHRATGTVDTIPGERIIDILAKVIQNFFHYVQNIFA